MPSSTLSRSPAKTLSAIGFRRWSVIVNSLISSPSKNSNAPNRRRRAPEQQEQHTNIAVHSEKRSVQLAEIICFDKRMFVRQQRRDYRDPHPRRPWQPETERQPTEQSNYSKMHHTRDQQSVGDPEFLGHGEEPGALIVLNILARVEHVKSPDPQRNRRAQN